MEQPRHHAHCRTPACILVRPQPCPCVHSAVPACIALSQPRRMFLRTFQVQTLIVIPATPDPPPFLPSWTSHSPSASALLGNQRETPPSTNAATEQSSSAAHASPSILTTLPAPLLQPRDVPWTRLQGAGQHPHTSQSSLVQWFNSCPAPETPPALTLTNTMCTHTHTHKHTHIHTHSAEPPPPAAPLCYTCLHNLLIPAAACQVQSLIPTNFISMRTNNVVSFFPPTEELFLSHLHAPPQYH